MTRQTEVYWGSIEWANDQLRFAISILQGKSGILSSLKGRIQLAIIIRKQLSECRYSWQASVLRAWIHRAQGGEFG